MSSEKVVLGRKPDGNYQAVNVDENGNLVTTGSIGGTTATQITDGVNTATITDVAGKKSVDVNVTNITLDKSDDSVTAYSPELKLILDEATSSITYIGKAQAGSSTSSSVWQITRFEQSGTQLIATTADGDFLFNNSWDNRAILTYS